MKVNADIYPESSDDNGDDDEDSNVRNLVMYSNIFLFTHFFLIYLFRNKWTHLNH